MRSVAFAGCCLPEVFVLVCESIGADRLSVLATSGSGEACPLCSGAKRRAPEGWEFELFFEGKGNLSALEARP